MDKETMRKTKDTSFSLAIVEIILFLVAIKALRGSGTMLSVEAIVYQFIMFIYHVVFMRTGKKEFKRYYLFIRFFQVAGTAVAVFTLLMALIKTKLF